MDSLIFLILGVGFAISIGFSVFWSFRIGRAWRNVGDRVDFEFVDGGWGGEVSLDGAIDGVAVTAFTETRGTGKQKRYYTNVWARLRGRALDDLTLTHEGILQKMGKVLGHEDIQLGDEELDDAFIITGFGNSEARDFLKRADMRRALLDGQRRHKELSVDSDKVSIQVSGRCSNAKTLESYIRTTVDVARAINAAWEDRERPQPDATDQSAQASRSPEPALETDHEEAVLSGLQAPATEPFDRDSDLDDSESSAGPSEPRAVGEPAEKGNWW